MSLGVPKNLRSKTFESLDSLWFEKARRDSFIEWPVKFIKSHDLAAEGFYYLRTKDHCACAFCRGIIGNWEAGDTPEGEHKRLFPHCSIVRGTETENVPLDKFSSKIHNEQALQDVDGRYATKEVSNGLKFRINERLSLIQYGFKEHCGPKYTNYLSVESRLKTFKLWPERVYQKPEELARAGLFYCGLSDHVRCFHCAHGLRNWEFGDIPHDLHAKSYPDCIYIYLSEREPSMKPSTSVEVRSDDKKGELTTTFEFKWIIQGEVESLREELRKLKDNLTCRVCMDEEALKTVYLPCKHMVTCASCTSALDYCPICRRRILHAFKPLRS